MRRGQLISFLVLVVHIMILATPVYATENFSLSSGSGFFITPTVVVTSNHIISGATRIEILYNNEIQLRAQFIASDEMNDLALLRVFGLEEIASPLILANSNSMREGSRVYTVGFPLPSVMGMQPKLSEGLISSIAGIRGDFKMFQISAPVQPGNSGGPLLNDRAEVVGVVTGCLNAAAMLKFGIIPQNVNYAVKINNIRSLIEKQGLKDSLSGTLHNESLSAADVMDIAKKSVVCIMAIQ